MLCIPNTVLLFASLFFKETESFCVTQARLENLDSSDPHASVSQALALQEYTTKFGDTDHL